MTPGSTPKTSDPSGGAVKALGNLNLRRHLPGLTKQSDAQAPCPRPGRGDRRP